VAETLPGPFYQAFIKDSVVETGYQITCSMKKYLSQMLSFKNIHKIIACICACLMIMHVQGQDLQADNMLLFQRPSGGWSKQFKGKALKYDVEFSAADRSAIAGEVKKDDANIDNMSTTKEIRYLVKAFKATNNPGYLAAAEDGIRYLLKAQYKNGGWPQYYPLVNLYRGQVTFNDNAIINVMKVLQDVALKQNDLEVVNPKFIEPAAKAVEKGIECILKTQIRVNGALTAWCQQYDEVTLKPAKARAYELPSISAGESAGIVQFLMSQPNPTPEIKKAIRSAIEWLDQVKIVGYKVIEAPAPGTTKGYDRQLVTDPASTIWARYYEIGTNKPFFCDRDGVVKYSYAELDYERRNGYAWFGNWGKTLLEKTYPAWAKINSGN
jgi:PelA/Pel-15E family pectate lyase